MSKFSKKNLIGVILAILAVILIAVFIGATRNTPTESGSYEIMNFPQKETELSAVPDDLKSNAYLNLRGVGACDKFLGDVHVTVIFVEDDKSVWNEEDKEEFKKECENTFKRIKSDAEAYGKNLNIESDYKETKVMFPYTYSDYSTWADSVLSSLDMSAYADANLSLEREFGADEAVIMFALNFSGRSFTANSENSEYIIMFSDSPAIYHELCHVFGACDFYFPEEAEKIAEEHLSGSIMYDCYGGKMDDFTAYIIGWKDELSENAKNFLSSTMHITKEQIEEAKQYS